MDRGSAGGAGLWGREVALGPGTWAGGQAGLRETDLRPVPQGFVHFSTDGQCCGNCVPDACFTPEGQMLQVRGWSLPRSPLGWP